MTRTAARSSSAKSSDVIANDTTVTVMALETSEILATTDIDPTKTYWRNTQKAPGRWPEAHYLSPMSRLITRWS